MMYDDEDDGDDVVLVWNETGTLTTRSKLFLPDYLCDCLYPSTHLL